MEHTLIVFSELDAS
jgi:hypothetical protein